MDAMRILERLSDIGITVTVSGDRLRLEPGTQVPPALLDEVRAHKPEIIFHLKRYRLKYPDSKASVEELVEIKARVDTEGYVLLWSTVLRDLLAFYRDEEARTKIPPGFVPYSDNELRQLFGEGEPRLSEDSLRLIHEGKKQGGYISSYKPIRESG